MGVNFQSFPQKITLIEDLRLSNFSNDIFLLIQSCFENFINFCGLVFELLLQVLQTDGENDNDIQPALQRVYNNSTLVYKNRLEFNCSLPIILPGHRVNSSKA